MSTPAAVVRAVAARAVFAALALVLLNVAVVPQMRARIALPETYAVSATQLEREMLDMINRERRTQGLGTLVMDAELISLAREHSQDMVERQYFSHNTPEGKSPFDRFVAARIDFREAGENLAYAPSLDIAHNGLMNSRDHRDNILHRAFGRVGIGIIDAGRRGLMISQEFRD